MNKEELHGAFDFLSKAYNANWIYRWDSTPFMSEALSQGKAESILGHKWAMMELWYQLKTICPHLDAVINSERLYEGILIHDLGETLLGDIPMVKQLKGEGKDKHLSERESLAQMSDGLPSHTITDMLGWFDEFEKKIDQITDLDVLLAKFLDALQADHFALTFGNNLPDHSDLISKIVNKRFVPYTKRFLAVLRDKNITGATEEVSRIAEFHIDQIRSIGIELETEDIFCQFNLH